MRVVLAIKVYPFSPPANLQQQLIRPLVIASCELGKYQKTSQGFVLRNL